MINQYFIMKATGEIFSELGGISSYPYSWESMICIFLNATADGYNPYRITSDGINWEIIEPDDTGAI